MLGEKPGHGNFGLFQTFAREQFESQKRLREEEAAERERVRLAKEYERNNPTLDSLFGNVCLRDLDKFPLLLADLFVLQASARAPMVKLLTREKGWTIEKVVENSLVSFFLFGEATCVRGESVEGYEGGVALRILKVLFSQGNRIAFSAFLNGAADAPHFNIEVFRHFHLALVTNLDQSDGLILDLANSAAAGPEYFMFQISSMSFALFSRVVRVLCTSHLLMDSWNTVVERLHQLADSMPDDDRWIELLDSCWLWRAKNVKVVPNNAAALRRSAPFLSRDMLEKHRWRTSMLGLALSLRPDWAKAAATEEASGIALLKLLEQHPVGSGASLSAARAMRLVPVNAEMIVKITTDTSGLRVALWSLGLLPRITPVLLVPRSPLLRELAWAPWTHELLGETAQERVFEALLVMKVSRIQRIIICFVLKTRFIRDCAR